MSIFKFIGSRGNYTNWNLSYASFNQSFSVSGQDTFPTDLFFKPDGTKMYVVGDVGDDVNEYDLSSDWDVSSASYYQNFSVSSQTTDPRGVFFKPDGTKMYICSVSSNAIYEYDLSSAWDISTASYLHSYTLTDTTPAPEPEGLFFKTDGTKMYIIDDYNDDFREYNLSSAWDVSSASFSVATPSSPLLPGGLYIRSDGIKMYSTGNSGSVTNEYNLASPWSVGSISLVQSTTIASGQGLHFKPDGSKMYVVETGTDSVQEYNLG